MLSSAAISSSQLVGCFRPSLSKISLLAQTQLVECTLTGAATHLPSYFEKACKAGGTTLSQPSLPARSFRSAVTPCLAQSVMSNPNIWDAMGGLPAATRDRNTVIACSPPPPATGTSFHATPSLSSCFLSNSKPAASPPEVHQCSTSTSSAA